MGGDGPSFDGDGLALVSSRVIGMRTRVVGHAEDFKWLSVYHKLVMKSRGIGETELEAITVMVGWWWWWGRRALGGVFKVTPVFSGTASYRKR